MRTTAYLPTIQYICLGDSDYVELDVDIKSQE